MRSTPLHVITAIANPLGWRSRINLYRAFERHMLDSGVKLTVVECAYGDRPFECASNPNVTHVPVRARSILWNKENLLNLAIARLPGDWRYLAWIDADIRFRRPDWGAATIDALQIHHIIQPWSHCYDLGPQDEYLHVHRSFGHHWQSGQAVAPGPYSFPHPGYAWAATRDAIESVGGLIETASLGAGDHHMALALAGRVEASLPEGLTEGYRHPLLQWEARAARYIDGNIGAIHGGIEHFWHGSKIARKYVDRWKILLRHRFDPFTDLRRNIWGVLELAGNKPELRRDIERYFRDRDEDANTMGAELCCH